MLGTVQGLPAASDNTILAVDVEGFGNHRRTDPVLVAVRAAVHRIVETACVRAGVPWKRCYREGTGDGVFVVIPAQVPKRLLSTPLPDELAAALHEYNETCAEQARIRLRAAVHAGQVQRDAHGVAGTAVNLTFRLLDSRALRSALARSPGLLAVIASDWFFDDVIRHDPDSDLDAYRRVRVRVKETKRHAWVTCPDGTLDRAGRRRVVHAAAGLVVVGGLTTAAASGILTPPAETPGDNRAVAEARVSAVHPTPTPTGDPRNANGGQTPKPAVQQPADDRTPPGPPTPGGPATQPATTTSTGTVPSSPPTSSPAPRTNGDAVEEERSVQLSTEPGQESVEMDWWRQSHDRTGDLQVDSTGVLTTSGAQLAVVEDATQPTRDRCRQVQTWSTRVDFAQLHVGSKLCARTVGGRYAMIDVNALPDSSASRFVFYGRTWEL